MFEIGVALIALCCVAIHPLQKAYGVGFHRIEQWYGSLEAHVSTTAYCERDLEFTFCAHPQHVQIQITLWFVSLYFGWSMFGTRGDCDQEPQEDHHAHEEADPII